MQGFMLSLEQFLGVFSSTIMEQAEISQWKTFVDKRRTPKTIDSVDCWWYYRKSGGTWLKLHFGSELSSDAKIKPIFPLNLSAPKNKFNYKVGSKIMNRNHVALNGMRDSTKILCKNLVILHRSRNLWVIIYLSKFALKIWTLFLFGKTKKKESQITLRVNHGLRTQYWN